MARFEIRQFRIVGALLLIVLTSGCASWWSAVPLAKSDIALKPEPIPGFQINSIEAYRMPEGLFIKGIVKRVDYKNATREKAHIDLVFEAEDGSLLGEASARYYPEVVAYMRHRSSRFNLMIHDDISPGVTVKVVHHMGDVHKVVKPLKTSGPYALLAGFPV